MEVRAYREMDLQAMAEIWNEVVEEGVAFPQTERLSLDGARELFSQQSLSAVAEEGGEILGLYILHPNNVGRCAHVASAGCAVSSRCRGRGVGEALVRHCLQTGGELGFRLLQFNAVVKTNARAIRLYERLGFRRIGEVPGGFLMKDGHYEDIALFYHEL